VVVLAQKDFFKADLLSLRTKLIDEDFRAFA